MPHTQTEEDLIFDFDYAFNKPNTRFETKYLRDKTSIRPVDFLLELDDRYRFIEIKDPDCPNPVNPEKFEQDMASGEIIEDLSRKFRDSYFFFSLQSKPRKEVEYVVLISWSKMDSAAMLSRTDLLRRTIPWTNGSFQNSPLVHCIVMNMEAWKEKFGDGSVWRVSEFES
ncbi:hypothetical protein [uncultured Rubinisphaera sp.]|uniref:hypothetical protein n=1 Tax=uncultured Rubinisphaera sp. TaxID=1678686 RepID=UPI0030DCA55C